MSYTNLRDVVIAKILNQTDHYAIIILVTIYNSRIVLLI